jgi:hypothetical protein
MRQSGQLTDSGPRDSRNHALILLKARNPPQWFDR